MRFDLKKKVLVLCHDTIGAKMAGPGIRYQNIADQISKVAKVTLAVFSDSKDNPQQSSLPSVGTTGNSYERLFDKHDIIFAQWLSREMLQYASSTGKVVIIDLYAPVPIEYLASLGFSGKQLKEGRDIEFSGVLETYKQYLSLGDYFVCSNERQRDFWIGFMTSSNILMPTNFGNRGKLDNLVLCPMGISSVAPETKSLKLRDRLGLKKDDFVLLWTGGIWDWFDAEVVIKAVQSLSNPRIKLVFMGTEHPNSKISEMSESKAARALAKSLGLIGKSVFFLDGWVEYSDRASYLLDADAAIYSDKYSVETRFSHRTRVLDHIWAGLPTICSQGDYLSDILSDKSMAIAASERTPKSFADIIDRAYKNPALLDKIKSNISRERHKFTWDEVSADLLSFIKYHKLDKKKQPEIPVLTPSKKFTGLTSKILRRVKNSIKVLIGRANV